MSFFKNLSTVFGDQNSAMDQGRRKKRSPKKSTPKKKSHQKNIQKKKQKSQKQHHPQKKQPQQKVSQKPQPARRPTHPTKKQIEEAEKAAKMQAQNIIREARAKAREIIVESKDESLAIHSKAEKKAQKLEKKLIKQQNFLERKLDRLDHKLDDIDKREERLEKSKNEIDQLKKDLTESKKKVLKKLEDVSGMTKDEAKEYLLSGMEKKLSKEMSQLIREREEEAKQVADEKAQEILIDSMRYGATDYVAEYTVSVVDLPNEEVKGKIIGKNGRNIHTFERITGVDVDLDSSSTEVKLSCFDSVRREIARVSLEKLIKDGRIQPARIEEVVKKVRKDIEKTIFEAGKRLCHEVGVYNIPTDLMKMLGRFKYRFSYGQNMIKHTLEETRIGVKLAHELGVDVNVVKLGCLLHDIGKVSDEVDGNHVELGVKIAKRYDMPQSVVNCIAQHHEDEPFTGVEQIVVYIADAISGARPGARYENFDEYIKRLEKMEEIATNYEEVKKSYAVQAGRELRVILDPVESKDDDVQVLATKIKDQVRENVIVPGSIKVTVIRETRASDISK